jgi:zinc-ribbon domain
MARCPSCGVERRDGAKFCEECGSPLITPPARPVAEERKVVTALFCDLVGFTAPDVGGGRRHGLLRGLEAGEAICLPGSRISRWSRPSMPPNGR